MFYELFLERIKQEKTEVTHIEQSQETDNGPALHLANKMEFKVEATFPDWLPRRTGDETYTRKWFIGERFLSRLEPEIEKQSIPLISFTPQLPLLTVDRSLSKAIELKKVDEKIYCYNDNKLIATCSLDAGVRRYAHIQFWDIQPEPDCDSTLLQNFLRELAVLASQEYKKVEIFVSNQEVLNATAVLGFHYRGQKVASRKVGNTYYNEAGVDLSFFNIKDTKEMLSTLEKKDGYQLAKVSSVLTNCEKSIEKIFENGQIDLYGKLYLENLAFQMTRESLGETRLYSEETAPFNKLIAGLPDMLKTDFISLANLVNPKWVPAEQIASLSTLNTGLKY